MPKSPSAIEVPVKDIFSSNYLFNIPGYQRPYAWTEQQARELFDDLWSFLQSNPEPPSEDQKAQDDAPTYFLGSIVLIKEKDKPEAIVVDGQQRLTTLTLLLSAIRAKVAKEAADAIGEFLYEKGNKISKLPDRYRLQLRPLDSPFFNKYVQQPDGIAKLVALDSGAAELDTDAKRLLRANAAILDARLNDLNPQEREDLAICIANRCYLVAVCTADFRSAFRIFSVLNSRGLDLSPTDILKARLLESISETTPQRADAVTKSWESIEVELGRDGFLELFTHVRAILRKTKAKESILEELTTELKSMKAAEFHDQILLPSKAAFSSIRDADFQHSVAGEAVNSHLVWLNRLDFKDWVPPAITFWIRNETDGDRMLKFFADLERLAYSMLIRRESDTVRISRFGEVTRAIEQGDELWSAASKLQLNRAEQWSTYEVLNGAFYQEIRSASARKSVLLRLDSLLATGEASYDHPIISVEHVLPQNPESDSEWIEWFPSLELRSHWTHRLGNLVLLAKSVNSSARNYPFERKKNSYFVRKGVTTFALTTPVIGLKEWTPAVVEQRQRVLVAILEKHWRLENRQSLAELANELVKSGLLK
jgi:hypothetical protein